MSVINTIKNAKYRAFINALADKREWFSVKSEQRVPSVIPDNKGLLYLANFNENYVVAVTPINHDMVYVAEVASPTRVVSGVIAGSERVLVLSADGKLHIFSPNLIHLQTVNLHDNVTDIIWADGLIWLVGPDMFHIEIQQVLSREEGLLELVPYRSVPGLPGIRHLVWLPQAQSVAAVSATTLYFVSFEGLEVQNVPLPTSVQHVGGHTSLLVFTEVHSGDALVLDLIDADITPLPAYGSVNICTDPIITTKTAWHRRHHGDYIVSLLDIQEPGNEEVTSIVQHIEKEAGALPNNQPELLVNLQEKADYFNLSAQRHCQEDEFYTSEYFSLRGDGDPLLVLTDGGELVIDEAGSRRLTSAAWITDQQLAISHKFSKHSGLHHRVSIKVYEPFASSERYVDLSQGEFTGMQWLPARGLLTLKNPVYTEGYYVGKYVSEIYPLSALTLVEGAEVLLSGTTPSNTSVTFEFRVSYSNEEYAHIQYSDWSANLPTTPSGAQLKGVQFRVFATTTDTNTTPLIQGFQLNSTQHALLSVGFWDLHRARSQKFVPSLSSSQDSIDLTSDSQCVSAHTCAHKTYANDGQSRSMGTHTHAYTLAEQLTVRWQNAHYILRRTSANSQHGYARYKISPTQKQWATAKFHLQTWLSRVNDVNRGRLYSTNAHHGPKIDMMSEGSRQLHENVLSASGFVSTNATSQQRVFSPHMRSSFNVSSTYTKDWHYRLALGGIQRYLGLRRFASKKIGKRYTWSVFSNPISLASDKTQGVGYPSQASGSPQTRAFSWHEGIRPRVSNGMQPVRVKLPLFGTQEVDGISMYNHSGVLGYDNELYQANTKVNATVAYDTLTSLTLQSTKGVGQTESRRATSQSALTVDEVLAGSTRQLKHYLVASQIYSWAAKLPFRQPAEARRFRRSIWAIQHAVDSWKAQPVEGQRTLSADNINALELKQLSASLGTDLTAHRTKQQSLRLCGSVKLRLLCQSNLGTNFMTSYPIQSYHASKPEMMNFSIIGGLKSASNDQLIALLSQPNQRVNVAQTLSFIMESSTRIQRLYEAIQYAISWLALHPSGYKMEYSATGAHSGPLADAMNAHLVSMSKSEAPDVPSTAAHTKQLEAGTSQANTAQPQTLVGNINYDKANGQDTSTPAIINYHLSGQQYLLGRAIYDVLSNWIGKESGSRIQFIKGVLSSSHTSDTHAVADKLNKFVAQLLKQTASQQSAQVADVIKYFIASFLNENQPQKAEFAVEPQSSLATLAKAIFTTGVSNAYSDDIGSAVYNTQHAIQTIALRILLKQTADYQKLTFTQMQDQFRQSLGAPVYQLYRYTRVSSDRHNIGYTTTVVSKIQVNAPRYLKKATTGKPINVIAKSIASGPLWTNNITMSPDSAFSGGENILSEIQYNVAQYRTTLRALQSLSSTAKSWQSRVHEQASYWMAKQIKHIPVSVLTAESPTYSHAISDMMNYRFSKLGLTLGELIQSTPQREHNITLFSVNFLNNQQGHAYQSSGFTGRSQLPWLITGKILGVRAADNARPLNIRSTANESIRFWCSRLEAADNQQPTFAQQHIPLVMKTGISSIQTSVKIVRGVFKQWIEQQFTARIIYRDVAINDGYYIQSPSFQFKLNNQVNATPWQNLSINMLNAAPSRWLSEVHRLSDKIYTAIDKTLAQEVNVAFKSLNSNNALELLIVTVTTLNKFVQGLGRYSKYASLESETLSAIQSKINKNMAILCSDAVKYERLYQAQQYLSIVYNKALAALSHTGQQTQFLHQSSAKLIVKMVEASVLNYAHYLIRANGQTHRPTHLLHAVEVIKNWQQQLAVKQTNSIASTQEIKLVNAIYEVIQPLITLPKAVFSITAGMQADALKLINFSLQESFKIHPIKSILGKHLPNTLLIQNKALSKHASSAIEMSGRMYVDSLNQHMQLKFIPGTWVRNHYVFKKAHLIKQAGTKVHLPETIKWQVESGYCQHNQLEVAAYLLYQPWSKRFNMLNFKPLINKTTRLLQRVAIYREAGKRVLLSQKPQYWMPKPRYIFPHGLPDFLQDFGPFSPGLHLSQQQYIQELPKQDTAVLSTQKDAGLYALGLEHTQQVVRDKRSAGSVGLNYERNYAPFSADLQLFVNDFKQLSQAKKTVSRTIRRRAEQFSFGYSRLNMRYVQNRLGHEHIERLFSQAVTNTRLLIGAPSWLRASTHAQAYNSDNIAWRQTSQGIGKLTVDKWINTHLSNSTTRLLYKLATPLSTHSFTTAYRASRCSDIIFAHDTTTRAWQTIGTGTTRSIKHSGDQPAVKHVVIKETLTNPLTRTIQWEKLEALKTSANIPALVNLKVTTLSYNVTRLLTLRVTDVHTTKQSISLAKAHSMMRSTELTYQLVTPSDVPLGKVVQSPYKLLKQSMPDSIFVAMRHAKGFDLYGTVDLGKRTFCAPIPIKIQEMDRLKASTVSHYALKINTILRDSLYAHADKLDYTRLSPDSYIQSLMQYTAELTAVAIDHWQMKQTAPTISTKLHKEIIEILEGSWLTDKSFKQSLKTRGHLLNRLAQAMVLPPSVRQHYRQDLLSESTLLNALIQANHIDNVAQHALAQAGLSASTIHTLMAQSRQGLAERLALLRQSELNEVDVERIYDQQMLGAAKLMNTLTQLGVNTAQLESAYNQLQSPLDAASPIIAQYVEYPNLVMAIGAAFEQYLASDPRAYMHYRMNKEQVANHQRQYRFMTQNLPEVIDFYHQTHSTQRQLGANFAVDMTSILDSIDHSALQTKPFHDRVELNLPLNYRSDDYRRYKAGIVAIDLMQWLRDLRTDYREELIAKVQAGTAQGAYSPRAAMLDAVRNMVVEPILYRHPKDGSWMWRAYSPSDTQYNYIVWGSL
ncbi:hypothetical protein [Pseudoalteromonas peptidolytica]|uniref:Uncharacterized protein n=1 Tax=Pseudoalteromonas peptidolytica F12-50-A1 TaxID=1315280 RepID=A0A8I0MYU6_9GAMM|nr:hypothetical protein [Pseudoalteromonas peptidolytica]MBE0347862.1 hypothetical protein [Pseudoalteromonas peptidolytica F12-50-A1]NLR15338.1 hypothetical protein [Pseudoalteromonas peptidolytica]GEK07982.1 hypothetical protein PPE03_02310 [Pseudoalteromonas peptidolytica]